MDTTVVSTATTRHVFRSEVWLPLHVDWRRLGGRMEPPPHKVASTAGAGLGCGVEYGRGEAAEPVGSVVGALWVRQRGAAAVPVMGRRDP